MPSSTSHASDRIARTSSLGQTGGTGQTQTRRPTSNDGPDAGERHDFVSLKSVQSINEQNKLVSLLQSPAGELELRSGERLACRWLCLPLLKPAQVLEVVVLVAILRWLSVGQQ
jgi:hypothetical protein